MAGDVAGKEPKKILDSSSANGGRSGREVEKASTMREGANGAKGGATAADYLAILKDKKTEWDDRPAIFCKAVRAGQVDNALIEEMRFSSAWDWADKVSMLVDAFGEAARTGRVDGLIINYVGDVCSKSIGERVMASVRNDHGETGYYWESNTEEELNRGVSYATENLMKAMEGFGAAVRPEGGPRPAEAVRAAADLLVSAYLHLSRETYYNSLRECDESHYRWGREKRVELFEKGLDAFLKAAGVGADDWTYSELIRHIWGGLWVHEVNKSGPSNSYEERLQLSGLIVRRAEETAAFGLLARHAQLDEMRQCRASGTERKYGEGAEELLAETTELLDKALELGKPSADEYWAAMRHYEAIGAVEKIVRAFGAAMKNDAADERHVGFMLEHYQAAGEERKVAELYELAKRRGMLDKEAGDAGSIALIYHDMALWHGQRGEWVEMLNVLVDAQEHGFPLNLKSGTYRVNDRIAPELIIEIVAQEGRKRDAN